MLKVLVSVYDKVANIYSAPMVEPNMEVAKRNFKIGVRQNQMIMANPGDFELVLIGEFEDQPASGAPVINHYCVVDGMDFRIPVSEIIGVRSDSQE